MSVKLNIPERVELNKLLGLLVCTTAFRREVESLIQELNITDVEAKEQGVCVVDGVLACNDLAYVKDISPIGNSVRNTIQFFIENGKEQFGNDSLYEQAVVAFGKIL